MVDQSKGSEWSLTEAVAKMSERDTERFVEAVKAAVSKAQEAADGQA